MSTPERVFPRRFAAAAVLFLGAAGLFWPATGYPFINYDDPGYAAKNPHVLGGLSWAGAAWAAGTFHEANWHPLTWLSLQFDATLYGPGPAGFHRTNVLLHAATTVLVFVALTILTGCPARCWVVAALFGLHPLRVESVAWVAERKDVLSGFFGVACLAAYGMYARTRRPGWYWATAGLLAAGLTAKPMLVTWPFLMALLDYWPLRRAAEGWGRLAREKWPFAVLVMASCAVTFAAQLQGGAVRSVEERSPTARVSGSVVAYCVYVGKTLWPTDLAVLYPHPLERPLWVSLGAAGAVVVASGAVVHFRRIAPHLFVGWFWFLGTLVPVIGLVQVGEQAYADRYTYLPQIGLLIAGVWAAAAVANALGVSAAKRAAAVVVLLAAEAAVTAGQLRHWSSNHALWSHTVAVTENNPIAWYHLGHDHFQRDEWDDALRCFDEAVRLAPGYCPPRVARCTIYVKHREYDRAEAEGMAALDAPVGRDAAHLSRVWYDLGCASRAGGRLDEAAERFRRALAYSDGWHVHADLGGVLAQLGRPAEAVPHMRAADAANPGQLAIVYNLGTALLETGDTAAAVAKLWEAARLAPDNAAVRGRLALALRAAGEPPPEK
ncbi:MAG: tetratricopeptide repeat protein [Fimbriiglobus sp.]